MEEDDREKAGLRTGWQLDSVEDYSLYDHGLG